LSGIFSIFTFVWSAQRDRKQATLDAFNTLQGEVFDKLNLYSPSEISEIIKNTRSEDYKTVSALIARLEHFCVGVNTRIYDRRVVYKLAHGYLDGPVILDRINPVIDRKLRNAEEDYYENIHKVIEWMEHAKMHKS
jgi:hypothetical protein